MLAPEKLCRACGIVKSRGEFYPRGGDRGYISSRCKACERGIARARGAALAAAEPDRVRGNFYRRTYGIGVDDYDAMMGAQGGLCALCRRPPHGRYRLCVDHDHVTGRVRGLLCGPCNQSLGNLGDDTEGLSRALDYVRGSAA